MLQVGQGEMRVYQYVPPAPCETPVMWHTGAAQRSAAGSRPATFQVPPCLAIAMK